MEENGLLCDWTHGSPFDIVTVGLMGIRSLLLSE